MKKLILLTIFATFALASCTPSGTNSESNKDLSSCKNHDVEYSLSGISGIYYGNQYAQSEDVYSYCVILAPKSNICNMLTGSVEFETNSQYLFLDLYSNTPAENGLQFKIPNGTYHLDPEESTAANTLGYQFSFLIATTEDIYETVEPSFKHGTVTITDSLIDAIFIDSEDKVYHIQGINAPIDNTGAYDNCKIEGIFSTMTENVHIPFANESSAIETYLWGDFLWNGLNLWDVNISDTASNDQVKLRLMVDDDKAFPEGTYPVSGDFTKENVLHGFEDVNTILAGSWFFKYAEGSNDLVAFGPITEGSVTFSPIVDGVVTITIDVKDELGYSITGVCKAAVPEAARSSAKGLATKGRRVLRGVI